MKKFGTLALCAALLCGTQAQAQTYQNQDYQMRSGGVGESSRGSMEDSQKNYSFKAVFTGEKGIYLSDVDVRILNKRGQEVVNSATDGPMLLAHLPPGRYTLQARAGGHEKTQKFTVAKRGLKTVYIRFPIRDDNGWDHNRQDQSRRGYNQEDQWGVRAGETSYEQTRRWNSGNTYDEFYPQR